jgi:hypothetical protein
MVFYGMLSYSHAGSESTHPLSYVLPTRIGAEAQLFNDTGSLMCRIYDQQEYIREGTCSEVHQHLQRGPELEKISAGNLRACGVSTDGGAGPN